MNQVAPGKLLRSLELPGHSSVWAVGMERFCGFTDYRVTSPPIFCITPLIRISSRVEIYSICSSHRCIMRSMSIRTAVCTPGFSDPPLVVPILMEAGPTLLPLGTIIRARYFWRAHKLFDDLRIEHNRRHHRPTISGIPGGNIPNALNQPPTSPLAYTDPSSDCRGPHRHG